MNLKIPEFIRIAQESGRELDVPGTLLRLDHDKSNGYTHGVVVEIADDGKIVILPGNSRSEVLAAEGERVGIYIDPGQLEQIGAVYDGRIGQMPRVVSKDAQTEPPKTLPYDPEQPGHYLYVEKPADQAPPGAAPVDEGSIPTVLYERTLPQGGDEINKLRQTLNNAAKMSRTLAIHIADAEDMRKQTAEFSTLVNAAQDAMRRSEERSRYDYRDPSGKLLQEPTKRSKDMYVALSMMDKIRSGMETSGLFLLQYRNVIYQLKLHSDIVQRFMVSKQGDEMMKFRDWMMTYNEFANAWARDAIARNKVFVDAAGALRKAWDRYRAKHSIFLRRELTRFGRRKAQKGLPKYLPGQHVEVTEAANRKLDIHDGWFVVHAVGSTAGSYNEGWWYQDEYGDIILEAEIEGLKHGSPSGRPIDVPSYYLGQTVRLDYDQEWSEDETTGLIGRITGMKNDGDGWYYYVDVDLEHSGWAYESSISPTADDPISGFDEPVIARKAQLQPKFEVGQSVSVKYSNAGKPFTGKIRFKHFEHGWWYYYVDFNFEQQPNAPAKSQWAPEEIVSSFDPLDSGDDEPVIARKAQLLEEPVQGEKLYTTRKLTTYGMRAGEEVTVHSFALDRSIAPRWTVVAIRENGHTYLIGSDDLTRVKPKFKIGGKVFARRRDAGLGWYVSNMEFSPRDGWSYLITNLAEFVWEPESEINERLDIDPIGGADDPVIASKKTAQVAPSLGDFVKIIGGDGRGNTGYIKIVEIFSDGSRELTIEGSDAGGPTDDEYSGISDRNVKVQRMSRGLPRDEPKYLPGTRVYVTEGPYQGSYGIVDYMFSMVDEDTEEPTGWRVVIEFENIRNQDIRASNAIPEQYLKPWDQSAIDVYEAGDEPVIARRKAQAEYSVGDTVWMTHDRFPYPASGSRGVIKRLFEYDPDSGQEFEHAIIQFREGEADIDLDFITKEKPPVENGQSAVYQDHRYSGAPKEQVEIISVLHGYSGTWEAARVEGKESSFFPVNSNRIIQHQVSVHELTPTGMDMLDESDIVIARRKASILDEPRATLNPRVFDLSTDQQAPKMHPEVRAAVLDQLAKLNLPDDAIKTVLFFGSAAAYQYEETSDFDVTVVVDKDKTDMAGLMREISDDLFIGEHPVTYYLRTNDYPIEGSDALYDIRGDFWVRVPEASEGAIHKEEYADTVEDAVEWAKKLDLMIGETRRDAIDYEKLELAYKHVSEEKKAEVYERIKQKLSEISEDVAAFANESDKLHETRAKAFAEDLDKMGEDIAKKYLSRNWLPENVLYKILERYQYTKILKRFDKINDRRLEDGDQWVNEVKQLMPKHAQVTDVWATVPWGYKNISMGDHARVLSVKPRFYEVELDNGETTHWPKDDTTDHAPKFQAGDLAAAETIDGMKTGEVFRVSHYDHRKREWIYDIRHDGALGLMWGENKMRKLSGDPINEGEEVVIAKRTAQDEEDEDFKVGEEVWIAYPSYNQGLKGGEHGVITHLSALTGLGGTAHCYVKLDNGDTVVMSERSLATFAPEYKVGDRVSSQMPYVKNPAVITQMSADGPLQTWKYVIKDSDGRSTWQYNNSINPYMNPLDEGEEIVIAKRTAQLRRREGDVAYLGYYARGNPTGSRVTIERVVKDSDEGDIFYLARFDDGRSVSVETDDDLADAPPKFRRSEWVMINAPTQQRSQPGMIYKIELREDLGFWTYYVHKQDGNEGWVTEQYLSPYGMQHDLDSAEEIVIARRVKATEKGATVLIKQHQCKSLVGKRGVCVGERDGLMRVAVVGSPVPMLLLRKDQCRYALRVVPDKLADGAVVYMPHSGFKEIPVGSPGRIIATPDGNRVVWDKDPKYPQKWQMVNVAVDAPRFRIGDMVEYGLPDNRHTYIVTDLTHDHAATYWRYEFADDEGTFAGWAYDIQDQHSQLDMQLVPMHELQSGGASEEDIVIARKREAQSKTIEKFQPENVVYFTHHDLHAADWDAGDAATIISINRPRLGMPNVLVKLHSHGGTREVSGLENATSEKPKYKIGDRVSPLEFSSDVTNVEGIKYNFNNGWNYYLVNDDGVRWNNTFHEDELAFYEDPGTSAQSEDDIVVASKKAMFNYNYPVGEDVWYKSVRPSVQVAQGAHGKVVSKRPIPNLNGIGIHHIRYKIKFDNVRDLQEVTESDLATVPPKFQLGDKVRTMVSRGKPMYGEVTNLYWLYDVPQNRQWMYEVWFPESDEAWDYSGSELELASDDPTAEGEEIVIASKKAMYEKEGQDVWLDGDLWFSGTSSLGRKPDIPGGSHGVVVKVLSDHRVVIRFDSGLQTSLDTRNGFERSKPPHQLGERVSAKPYNDIAQNGSVVSMRTDYYGNWVYKVQLDDFDGPMTFSDRQLSREGFDPMEGGGEEIVIAQKQTQEFNVVDWLTETKEAVDDFTQNVEELKSMYSNDLMWLEQLEEQQASAEAQGAGVQTDPAVVQPVAASLKTGQEVYHVVSYTPDGELKDAEPLIVKASMLVSCDEHEVTVIGEHGSLKKFSRGRLITAQSEIRPRRRRDQNIIEKPGETDLEELLGSPKKPNQIKLTPTKKRKPKLKPSVPAPKQRPDVPPGMVPVDADPEAVGAEPAEPQAYDVSGEQVPVVQPPTLVQRPVPPKPSQPAPSVPTPDNLEEVRFDDIPEEEWRKMNLAERIRLAAVYNQLIAMEYEKITPPEEGVRKTYIIEPYSYRVKRPQRTNGTPVWYLFAFDTQDNHIKAFIVRNVRGIEILDQTFSPRWDVEFFPAAAWDKFRQNRRPQQPAPEEKVTFVTTPFES